MRCSNVHTWLLSRTQKHRSTSSSFNGVDWQLTFLVRQQQEIKGDLVNVIHVNDALNGNNKGMSKTILLNPEGLAL